MNFKSVMFIFLLFPLYQIIVAQPKIQDIRINQIGFYPHGPKTAIVVESSAEQFFITTPDLQDTIYTGTLSAPRSWQYSQETVKQADFSDVTTIGTYIVLVPDMGYSAPFDIKPRVHQEVARATTKAFYFQRMSIDLTEEYAGKWARPMGHPDTEVLVHASAASAERPEGTILSCPRGWYDAGDYNKYIVNSGISVYTLLSIYEHFPEYSRSLETNIPESGDAVPDVLDESLWNIRWMLAMQDPHDGGVYHKCTHANFSGVVMPHQATAPRYVVQKSSTAALDFASVMAQAARIFRDFEIELPGLADSCLTAALGAWDWARHHPHTYYRQNNINNKFDPDITTGEYGDSDDSDEFRWAAAELYITTQQDSFITAINPLVGNSASVPAWPSVGTLGLYSLAFHRKNLTAAIDTTVLKNRLIRLADDLQAELSRSAYQVMLTTFPWGSNAVAANQSMACIQAFKLTADSSYLDAAIANLDYLLGRNATTFCFVSGQGDKPPMHFHHRPSEADDVVEPIPGLLAGGPNPSQQDNCPGYPSNLPARSYLDDFCSYASNEICINWNSPIAYIASALEAIHSSTGRTNTISVSLKTPTAGEIFESSETISLSADASIAAGAIVKVEFYANNVKVGESGNAPFNIQWQQPSPGVYELRAKALGDMGDFHYSDPVRIIVMNAESIGSILFIVGSPDLSSGDVAIYKHLVENDYNVTIQPDDDSLAFDMEYKDAILVSASAGATRKVREELDNINVPILSWEPTLFDDFDWTGRRRNEDYGTASGTSIDILSDAHPIAAGLSGTIQVTSDTQEITWAIPHENADIIACLSGDPLKPVIFCYETEDVMMNYRTAKARQVGLFFSEESPVYFTDAACAILHAAISWVQAGERLSVEEEPSAAPRDHQLYQNYPNPFNPKTRIQYDLSQQANVTVTIYNSLGQKVKILVNQRQTAGRYSVLWDGTDEQNRAVSNGIYLYKMQAGDFVQTRKMVLMR
ncbi:T9SS C-terminal target domain-containing protein [candidate division KSB1 bacterium]|nr:glycoside hydrolase family 9 protein [candidate division KSB1 bacterium]RQW05760.1 MAG: T9SS C-terminal target domain-containing protein [candidate division KSB1 bacterium]